MGKRKVKREEKENPKFTKRCKGLFKKAEELSILCGSDIAVIITSRTGNLYTFLSPDLGAVINRYRGQANVQGGQREAILTGSGQVINFGNQEHGAMSEGRVIEQQVLEIPSASNEYGFLPSFSSIDNFQPHGYGFNGPSYFYGYDPSFDASHEVLNEQGGKLHGCLSISSSSSSSSSCGYGISPVDISQPLTPLNSDGFGGVHSAFDESGFDPSIDVSQYLNEDGEGGMNESGLPISLSSHGHGFGDNPWYLDGSEFLNEFLSSSSYGYGLDDFDVRKFLNEEEEKELHGCGSFINAAAKRGGGQGPVP